MTMARSVGNDGSDVNDWKLRNPAADRQLWGEPPHGRGRKLVVWLGIPILAVMIALAGFAVTHPRFHVTLPIGNNAPVVPARHYAVPAPAQPAEAAQQPAPPQQPKTRRSH